MSFGGLSDHLGPSQQTLGAAEFNSVRLKERSCGRGGGDAGGGGAGGGAAAGARGRGGGAAAGGLKEIQDWVLQ